MLQEDFNIKHLERIISRAVWMEIWLIDFDWYRLAILHFYKRTIEALIRQYY